MHMNEDLAPIKDGVVEILDAFFLQWVCRAHAGS